jgi:hypothetical protein
VGDTAAQASGPSRPARGGGGAAESCSAVGVGEEQELGVVRAHDPPSLDGEYLDVEKLRTK